MEPSVLITCVTLSLLFCEGWWRHLTSSLKVFNMILTHTLLPQKAYAGLRTVGFKLSILENRDPSHSANHSHSKSVMFRFSLTGEVSEVWTTPMWMPVNLLSTPKFRRSINSLFMACEEIFYTGLWNTTTTRACIGYAVFPVYLIHKKNVSINTDQSLVEYVII